MSYGIKEWIKIPDLKAGYLYRIAARNANYGIWIPRNESFLISRRKFGDNFLFEEYHWDCPAWATAKPLEEIEKSPFEIKEWTDYPEWKNILFYLNKFEKEYYE